MHRLAAFLALGLLFVPVGAQALQLRWSTGDTTLTFAQNTRATLLVQADSAQVLPWRWQLVWDADSSGIRFVALDSTLVCLADTAKVDSIWGPSTPADSAANQITAHFCSDGNGSSSSAYYLLDLVGGSQGKLKAVALNPADTTQVIESNEVTYNGGVTGDYPPVVLGAFSAHQSLQLVVTELGSGLNTATSMTLVATDSSWTLPLTVTAQSNRSVTGVAPVAALMPACQATVASGGAVMSAPLAADTQPATPEGGVCSGQYFEELLQPPQYSPPPQHGYTIQPKDFSFTRGFVDLSSNRYALHLFYIRHNYWYDQPPAQPDLNEHNIGHIWTTDFTSWHGPTPQDKADTVALSIRAGKFDELHVWAPTIVPSGPKFYMFYTGVRNEGGRRNQRIGVATSQDLNSWQPADTVVLSAPDIPWASKTATSYDGQQLRDPFVMEDPAHAGQWLMFFVAPDSFRSQKMSVGVARSANLRTWVADQFPLRSTEKATFQGATNIVESPHVFAHNSRWWLPYTVNNNQIFFETTASADPTDTTVANWTNPIFLQTVSQGQPAQLQYWHASEYLLIGATEYLAAYNDNASSIEITGIYPTDSAGVDSIKLGCPAIAGITNSPARISEVRLIVSRLRFGDPNVGLRVELPARMPVRLAVFDIAGRERQRLIDGELPAGVNRLTWSGQDRTSDMVASGVYFIRLTCGSGVRVSKVVMLR